MLSILKTAQHPARFAFQEVTIFVSFYRAHPSASDIIGHLVFSHVDELEHIIFISGFVFCMFCLGELLRIHAFLFCSCFSSRCVDLPSWLSMRSYLW